MISRVIVVGTSGSGKTSFAAELSSLTGIPHTQIDALYHQPNWVSTPADQMLRQLRDIASGDRWIVDGNYTMFTREAVWPRAQIVVWLDYSLLTVMRRVISRTFRRLITRQELWNGNRESFAFLLSKENIILWALTTHSANRRKYPRMVEAFPNVAMIRFRNPREAERWLAETSLQCRR